MAWYDDFKNNVQDTVAKVGYYFSSEARAISQLQKIEEQLKAYTEQEDRFVDNAMQNPCTLDFVMDTFTKISKLSLSDNQSVISRIERGTLILAKLANQNRELLIRQIKQLPDEKQALPIFALTEILNLDLRSEPEICPEAMFASMIESKNIYSAVVAQEFANAVIKFRNIPPISGSLLSHIKYALLFKNYGLTDSYNSVLKDAVEILRRNFEDILPLFDEPDQNILKLLSVDEDIFNKIIGAMFDCVREKDLDTILFFLEIKNRITPAKFDNNLQEEGKSLDDILVGKFFEYIKDPKNLPNIHREYSNIAIDWGATEKALRFAKEIPNIRQMLSDRNLEDTVVGILAGWTSNSKENSTGDLYKPMQTYKFIFFAKIIEVCGISKDYVMPGEMLKNYDLAINSLIDKTFDLFGAYDVNLKDALNTMLEHFPILADRFYSTLEGRINEIFDPGNPHASLPYIQYMFDVSTFISDRHDSYKEKTSKFAEKFNGFVCKNIYALNGNSFAGFCELMATINSFKGRVRDEDYSQCVEKYANSFDPFILKAIDEKNSVEYNLTLLGSLLKGFESQQITPRFKYLILKFVEKQIEQLENEFLLAAYSFSNTLNLISHYDFMIQNSQEPGVRLKYTQAKDDIQYFLENPKQLLFVKPGLAPRKTNLINPEKVDYNLNHQEEDTYKDKFVDYCLKNPECINEFIKQSKSPDDYKSQLKKLKYIINSYEDNFKFIISDQKEHKIDELICDPINYCLINQPIIVNNRIEDFNTINNWFNNSTSEPKDLLTNKPLKPGDISSASFLPEFIKYVNANMDRSLRHEAAELRQRNHKP